MPLNDCSKSADRLVASPVFVLSTMRSGSTLLRALLNSHSMIRAPHEMHLRTLEVKYSEFYTRLAMEKLGLDNTELEYLLWDRLLHRELVRSGKQIIADKTPGNALCWRRLAEAWPKARYIFLLRHPASVLSSMMDTSQSQWTGMVQMVLDQDSAPGGQPVSGATGRRDVTSVLADEVVQHAEGISAAMKALPGLTVRYEDLIAGPDGVTMEICDFLGVPWEPEMLKYGQHDHGEFQVFLGDFSEKIRSGEIRAARCLPDPRDIPAALRPICQAWGYLS